MEKKELLECIEVSDEGVYLDLDISPDSPSTEITGVNPWRDQLEVSVKEKAVHGEANKALIKFFAESLDLSDKKVRIVRGKTTRSKRMYFHGVDRTKLIDVIERIYEGNR
ncbi:MAG: DUF167 domain-containing protein [Candidatus Natronoplasma sp.]